MIKKIIIFLKKLEVIRNIPDNFTGHLQINCQNGYVVNANITESLKVA